MTKFIDATKEVEKEQEGKETVLTHIQKNNGWIETETNVKDFPKVIYLGKDCEHGDIFSCFTRYSILIYKGIKGDEFN